MQVHGVANDTIKFVQNIINTEINSATDNPVSSLPISLCRIYQLRIYLFLQIVYFFLTDFQDGFCRKRRDNFRWKFPWRISSQGKFFVVLFFVCLL